MPTATKKLLASLAVKSSDVAEIVKEELKKDAASEITAQDLLDVAKELSINADGFVPTGFVLVKKDDVVDKTKFDVVEKGSWVKNTSDPYEGMSPAAKEKMIQQDAEIKILKEKDVFNTLTISVGAEVAKEMTPFFMNLAEKDRNYLVSTISGLQKAVKDLGGSKGSQTNTDTTVSQAEMMKEVQAIASAEKLSESEAMIKWAERNPEKQARLQA